MFNHLGAISCFNCAVFLCLLKTDKIFDYRTVKDHPVFFWGGEGFVLFCFVLFFFNFHLLADHFAILSISDIDVSISKSQKYTNHAKALSTANLI